MITEHEEQKTLVQYLQAQNIMYFSVPNGSVLKGNPMQRARQMQKLKREGLVVGASDIVVMLPGKILFIEMKSKRGYASNEQKEFLKKVNKYEYAIGKVCKGCIEAIEFIRENK